MSGARLFPTAIVGAVSAKGAALFDATGTQIRINSVGWNEVSPGSLGSIDDNCQAMVKAGFNCIRLSWVNATMRQDLQTIDQVVASAGKVGLRVIIDNHTNEQGTPADGYGAQQKNGLWFDVGPGSDGTNGAGVQGTVDDARWISDWVAVANHFKGNPVLLGADARNEPLEYGGMCTWGDNSPTDLRSAYERMGKAVQAVNPDWMYFFEGPQNYNNQMPWGNLAHVANAPVRVGDNSKVTYSVHDYPAYVAGFQPDSGNAKVQLMDKAWGYLVRQNIAPVWIGECGANLDGSYNGENVGDSQAWADTLTDYLNNQLKCLVGTDWWAWGCLDGQQLVGTLDSSGNFRQAQKAVYSQWHQFPAGVPNVTPGPTPGPVAEASPDGTTITKVGDPAIIDATGAAWTLVATFGTGQCAVNGVADTSTQNVTKMAYGQGLIFQQNKDGGVWTKSKPSDAWQAAPASSFPNLPPAGGGPSKLDLQTQVEILGTTVKNMRIKIDDMRTRIGKMP